MRSLNLFVAIVLCTGFLARATHAQSDTTPHSAIPDTTPLTWKDDIASRMVDGIDRFLQNELNRCGSTRKQHWNIDATSTEAFLKSVEPNRRHLAHILGLRDKRILNDAFEVVATTKDSGQLAQGPGYTVFKIRWHVFGSIYGEGLLLEPTAAPRANVIALPDFDMESEAIAGINSNLDPASQYARVLAEQGCRVVVPSLINRQMKRRGPPGHSGRANLSNREFLYRSSFELGRHIIGYELQKILAAIDILDSQANEDIKIGITGVAEGGRLALYAAAIDQRIDVVQTENTAGTLQNMPEEPIDNNVFGVLDQFGEAYLQVLIAPRTHLTNFVLPKSYSLPSEGGAPANLKYDDDREKVIAAKVQMHFDLNVARDILDPVGIRNHGRIFEPDSGGKPFGYTGRFLFELGLDRGDEQFAEPTPAKPPIVSLKSVDLSDRQTRQVQQIVQQNEHFLRESPYVRDEVMKNLDTSSMEAFVQSQKAYRDHFRKTTIGEFSQPLLPFNARSRVRYEEETWTGYDIALDVYEDVFAYGVLLVPNDIKPDNKRPVVVCQHGLEGRPRDCIEGDHRAYHDFAAKLAERGFVVFAPQNPYIFRDRFRNLQRKANPLGKSLFSIITAQHQQIVNWLGEQSFVDKNRIGFYGLSYGGKTAMRVPALVDGYCLSICSADFNDWVWKNASTRSKYSYVWTGEYEIFEFDLGSTFNYSEMAALIAPRPFMVERGHFDGVAPDHRVASEFAKVRYLYQAKLGIGDRCEIEWFAGPHTINGKATFEFLHRHLRWPRR